MQISERSIAITNPTLKMLIAELGDECRTVTTLINQLQLPHRGWNDRRGSGWDICGICQVVIHYIHFHPLPLLPRQVFHQHPVIEEIAAPDFFQQEAIAGKV